MPILSPETLSTTGLGFDFESILDYLPSTKIVLHNDDQVYAGLVIEALQIVLQMNEQEAINKMLEAHRTGSANIYQGTYSDCVEK